MLKRCSSAAEGKAVESYALPGNAATGTMPNMAIGGTTTPATHSSPTASPVKAIVDKAGQAIREMNNKRVAAGVFVPPLTSCGSSKSLRGALQADEVRQALKGGFSFDAACQRHDACYDDCQKTKKACDDEFYQLMTAICDGVTNRSLCFESRKLYYSAVSMYGESAFAEARKVCASEVKSFSHAIIATAPVQQPTQAAVQPQAIIQTPTANIRPRAPLPVAVVQAIAPSRDVSNNSQSPASAGTKWVNVVSSAGSPANGTQVGAVKGTLTLNVNGKSVQLVALSNGKYDGYTDTVLAPHQCTNLIVRYADKLGLNAIQSTSDTGNAKDAAQNFANKSNNTFMFVDGSTGGVLPTPGAVLSIDNKTVDGTPWKDNSYGHTGIVQHVNVSMDGKSATVTLFDQNFPEKSGWKIVVFTNSNGVWKGTMANTPKSGSSQALAVAGWANPN